MFDLFNDSSDNIVEDGNLFSDDYLLDKNNTNFDDFSINSSDDFNNDFKDILDINL